MADDFDREAVLAQVAERRRRNDELVAELGLTRPEVMAACRREQARSRRRRRAEDAGQLDLSSGSEG